MFYLSFSQQVKKLSGNLTRTKEQFSVIHKAQTSPPCLGGALRNALEVIASSTRR